MHSCKTTPFDVSNVYTASGCRQADGLFGQQSHDSELESTTVEFPANSQLNLAGSARRIRRCSVATRRRMLSICVDLLALYDFCFRLCFNSFGGF